MEAALVTGTRNKGCWNMAALLRSLSSVSQKGTIIQAWQREASITQARFSIRSTCFPWLFGTELAENIADNASGLIVGNAIDAETQCGPMIRNR